MAAATWRLPPELPPVVPDCVRAQVPCRLWRVSLQQTRDHSVVCVNTQAQGKGGFLSSQAYHCFGGIRARICPTYPCLPSCCRCSPRHHPSLRSMFGLSNFMPRTARWSTCWPTEGRRGCRFARSQAACRRSCGRGSDALTRRRFTWTSKSACTSCTARCSVQQATHYAQHLRHRLRIEGDCCGAEPASCCVGASA